MASKLVQSKDKMGKKLAKNEQRYIIKSLQNNKMLHLSRLKA